MKRICAVDGILLIVLFYCCAPIPSYYSHPLEPNQTMDDDDSNQADLDYGLEPEDGDTMMDSYTEPSVQEIDIAEFVAWASQKDKKSPVPRVQTWRPSQKDVSDISVQSIGSIQAHLKCQPARGCNNCYVWLNNGLYPARCPSPGLAVTIQPIPFNTCLLFFLSISIFSFTNQF